MGGWINRLMCIYRWMDGWMEGGRDGVTGRSVVHEDVHVLVFLQGFTYCCIIYRGKHILSKNCREKLQVRFVCSACFMRRPVKRSRYSDSLRPRRSGNRIPVG